MTSRPPGSQPPQRPPQQRTVSQQFPPSSPARRNNDGFADLTLDGTDALGPYGTMPRNGGSRLKLEISKDSKNPSLVESPTSAATPTWKPSIPRGRPQLHFDVSKGDQIPLKPMPLPVRPGPHALPAPEKARAVQGNPSRKDARPRPYVLEVPTAAPHYTPNGHADFFPWTGNHPEDQFSETAIRQGFFDKAQMIQNETGSAKASIFPALKHKSGLQTLSSLFTGVLAQRRAHGQITSISTFKPPPRVTVTDTKREMWLKDLANPTISLRRLSRSIPHGIRGKVLLDQSLSKNIPIERAVWLAKCVGANELRSFRRKGASGTFAMGGEAKWIRDFTVCVEQFVESIVGSCGEKDFQNRINYAIRLAAHFYAEYLLDREHYMDWLVSSLESSLQAKLPVWLLITQLYWKDLLQYRKYGRRLAMALTNQLAETLTHPDRDILGPLLDRLQFLVKGLMVSNPESFVFPKTWNTHRSVLRVNFASEDDRFAATFDSIDRRNQLLVAPGTKKELSPRRRLIELLDTTFSKPFDGQLAQQCWQMTEDKALLIETVTEWSTSSHRPGLAKVYVAARILRFCSRSGVDISQALLNFLDSKVCESGRNKSAFYHLVSELARSEHFSAASYFQWLIARGGLYVASEVAPNGPFATRLMAELPLHNLSESMIGLRRTLLNRAEFSVDEEEEQRNACIALMNKSLPGMQASVDVELDIAIDVDLGELLPQLSQSNRSEVGLWLRQKVGLQMLQPTIPPLDDWDDSPMKGGTSAITASDFNNVRHYLEVMGDYSILADVLKIVTSSNDADVLASCADTLDLHLEIFAAIGALMGLFDILIARLRSLTDDVDYIPRVFLVALSELAARIPEQKVIAQQLAQELARSDRKTAADACSPVSDHMAGVVQTAEADFTDEIEKVLASGNSMDQATLERLFQRIALRLEESWKKSPEQHRSCGLLLTRLRTFDAQQFDLLMAAWVNGFLQLPTRPSMLQVFAPLISFGCLALSDVIVNAGSILEKLPAGAPVAICISHELLALIVAPSDLEGMTVEEAYRLRIKQRHFQKDNPVKSLIVIRQALENASLATKIPHLPPFDSANLLAAEGMYDIMQRLILIDTESMTETFLLPLLRNGNGVTATLTVAIVDKLLAADRHEERARPIAIEAVLNMADDFTLPFCQVKLASMFTMGDASAEDPEGEGSQRLQAFDNAIETAVAAENTTWACIVPLLDASIAQHLRQRAENQFLAFFPSPKATDAENSLENRVKHAENLLYIIDATAYSISLSSTARTLAPEIVSTLSNMLVLLSHAQMPEIKAQIISKWVPLLLSFITIQTSAFEASKAGHESRAKTVLALAAIILEFQALDTSRESIASLTEQTFDLALYLVDFLPEEMRQYCVRTLRDTVTNPRISYLFSVSPNPSEWLVLSQKEKVGAPPPGMSGPEARAKNMIMEKEKISPFTLRRWEMLEEPTPNVGENDTSLSLSLFGARRG